MKITIYQEINPTFRVDSNKKLYKIGDYKIVWEGEVVMLEESVEDFLEVIFGLFNNGNYPKNYEGHSLSVGDIVELENGDIWICADCGWNKVEWVQD